MTGPEERSALSRTAITAYSLPMAGYLYVQMIYNLYFFKYSTDSLEIAPAVIGSILFATRIWDGISDPVVGYVSDRTSSRLGRRRPWMFASALPVLLTTWLIWNPPRALGPGELAVWVAVTIVLWETAMTALFVPYMALGSEVSMDHHERTLVSGARHVSGGVGYVTAALAVQWLTSAPDRRDAAFDLSATLLPIAVALVVVGAIRMRERSEHRRRGPGRIWPALGVALRNPHLRLLCAIYFLEMLGAGTLAVLGAHFAHYVVGDEGLFPRLMLGYLLASYLGTPLVVWLSRRLGKLRLWIAGSSLQGLAFASMYPAAGAGEGFVLLAAIAIGLCASVAQIVSPSILADVTDYDEYRSGERKEGTYYAAINLTRKFGFATTAFVAGLALQALGFEPNVEQSETTRRAIRSLFAFLPLAMFTASVALLLRFRLDEREHARIRAAVRERE